VLVEGAGMSQATKIVLVTIALFGLIAVGLMVNAAV
jgi:hypothetical protein